MVASSDMLCYCYKSVWINPTEVIEKKRLFDVVIFKSCFVTSRYKPSYPLAFTFISVRFIE